MNLQLTCDLFFLLSSNSCVSSLNRNSVCRVEIAKPSRPPCSPTCSTRRTFPNASTRALGSDPWSIGRKTLNPIWIPDGGQVWARTNAPVSLMSWVRPSLRFSTPASVHQNTIGASRGNRMALRTRLGVSTVYPTKPVEFIAKIHRECYARSGSAHKKPNVPRCEGICLT